MTADQGANAKRNLKLCLHKIGVEGEVALEWRGEQIDWRGEH